MSDNDILNCKYLNPLAFEDKEVSNYKYDLIEWVSLMKNSFKINDEDFAHILRSSAKLMSLSEEDMRQKLNFFLFFLL